MVTLQYSPSSLLHAGQILQTPHPSLSQPPPVGITKTIPRVGKGLAQACRGLVGTLELALPAQSWAFTAVARLWLRPGDWVGEACPKALT